MKKIIDANYFRDPDLEKYLKTDRRNKVVFNEYACMEAYKGDALINLKKSIDIVSNYPDQVIVLKATSAIIRMKLSSKGRQKRFEDPLQTREFNIFCKNVRRASEGNMRLAEQIILNSQEAKKHFARLRKDVEDLVLGIEELGQTFQYKALKNIRRNENIPRDVVERMIRDILMITARLYKRLPDFVPLPTAEQLRNSYIFRFVLCSYLLRLRWVTDGGIRSAKHDKLLNDSVDMNYAAYATYFDGILTNDLKMKDIYLDASFLLQSVFN